MILQSSHILEHPKQSQITSWHVYLSFTTRIKNKSSSNNHFQPNKKKIAINASTVTASVLTSGLTPPESKQSLFDSYANLAWKPSKGEKLHDFLGGERTGGQAAISHRFWLGRLCWWPKIPPWKRRFLLATSIFRVQVHFSWICWLREAPQETMPTWEVAKMLENPLGFEWKSPSPFFFVLDLYTSIVVIFVGWK